MQEVTGDQDSPDAADAPVTRAFTMKAVVFGLLGLLFTIVYTAINDIYLRQTSFVANHLPPGPLFLVIGIALIWNPVWHSRISYAVVAGLLGILTLTYSCLTLDLPLWHPGHWVIIILLSVFGLKPVWQTLSQRCILSGKELIVALIIILVGCWTPGAGLNYFFSTTQVGMWTIYDNNVQMQNMETAHYIPEHLWPAGGMQAIGDDQSEKQRVFEAFKTGYREQGTEGVPWDAWLPSVLLHWIPLFALFSIALISLSLIVHRQWASHEQLAYPLAQIGSDVFSRESKRILPDIFYDNKFRIAVIGVVMFHGVRYLHVWFPNSFPDILTSTYFNFLLDIFPVIKKSGIYEVHAFKLFFSIIGICYFLSREIGLTIGIAPFILALFSAQVYIHTGVKVSSDDVSNMRVGAYFAYAAVIIYTGRHYYWSVLKKAITCKPGSEYEEDGIFASRMFLLSFAGLLLLLTFSFDLDFPLAFLFCLIGMLFFLVFTRIICETGIPYLQAAWDPGTVLIKFLGVSTVGAAPLVLLYYISSMLFADPKEAMMPYVANSLKMADEKKIKLKRLCIGIMLIVGGAIFVSIGTRLYQQYTMGGHALNYRWADHNVPSIILGNATRDLTLLDDIGQRTAPGVEPESGFLGRLSLLDPDVKTINYMLIGMAGVTLFFFLRFRFTGFMLHPVLFLIWGITPNARTFYSFLIGWFIRELIVRFGGGKVYQNMKPFFIGLIIGELFMGVLGMGVGALYYLYTDFMDLPPSFRVILG